jgi:hypothetical protein
VPLQQGSGRHDGRKKLQPLPTDPSRFGGQSSALVIVKVRSSTQLFTQHFDFFLKVFDHVLLMAVDPTRKTQEQ